jgi:hypothetical protein
MAITTMDGVVAGLAASQDISLFWASTSTTVGTYYNLNRIAGSAQGSAFTGVARTSGGGIPVDTATGYATITDAAAGKSLYIARLALVSTIAGNVAVYDRIYEASTFSGTVTGAQTITGFPTLPALRAPGNGDGLEIWLESHTAIGSTTSQISVQYTNSAGTSGRSTILESTTANFPVNRLQRLRLQDGDTGVQSIQSVTLASSTGTAGNFSVVLLERKCMIAMPIANVGTIMDFAALGLPQIQNDSALMFLHQSTTTTSGVITGSMNIISG